MDSQSASGSNVASEINADTIGSTSNQNIDERWVELCGKCDISSPPEHIKMAEGQSYDDMSIDEKYALHISSVTMAETYRRLDQVQSNYGYNHMIRQINKDDVTAVWYADPNGKNAPTKLKQSYATAEYSTGENLRFNGKKMVDLLPGRLGIPGLLHPNISDYTRRAYAAVGPYGKQGQDAFNLIVSHELGHITEANSDLMAVNKENAERAASVVYHVLYGVDK